MEKITKEDLIAFGMKENKNNRVFPMQKILSKPSSESGEISLCVTTLRNPILCVTTLRNPIDLCLVLPNGDVIYLAPKSIEDLKAFESCIQSWEPKC